MPVRQATPGDLTAIVRVINRAYVAESHLFYGDRTNDADISERLTKLNARIFVVDDPDAAAPGALAAAVYVELRGDRGYFGMLSVDPDRQGRGYGRELIGAAESFCANAGCAFMDIDVVEQRPELPGFYAPFGYVPVETVAYTRVETKVPIRMVRMAKALDVRHPS